MPGALLLVSFLAPKILKPFLGARSNVGFLVLKICFTNLCLTGLRSKSSKGSDMGPSSSRSFEFLKN